MSESKDNNNLKNGLFDDSLFDEEDFFSSEDEEKNDAELLESLSAKYGASSEEEKAAKEESAPDETPKEDEAETLDDLFDDGADYPEEEPEEEADDEGSVREEAQNILPEVSDESDVPAEEETIDDLPEDIFDDISEDLDDVSDEVPGGEYVTDTFSALSEDGQQEEETASEETSEEIPEPETEPAAEESVSETEEEPAEVPEERELTTDEAIEKFLKGDLKEDDTPGDALDELMSDLPENLVNPAAEPAAEENDSFTQTDIALPEGIENIELNSADENTIGTTDMNLRIAFGLEDNEEDSENVKSTVKKIGDRFESEKRTIAKYKPDHVEFTDTIQAKDFAYEYKVKRRNIRFRIIAAFIVTALLAIYENIEPITKLLSGSPKQFAGVFDPAVYPVVHIMASLQLMLLVAILALPEIVSGVRKLFKGYPTPESLTAVLMVFGVVYSGIASYFADPLKPIYLYNAVPAMSGLMTLLYSRMNIKREMMSFFIAGSKKTKYVMRRMTDDDAVNNFYSDDEEVDEGEIMQIEKAGFVDGFFSRMAVPDGMSTTYMTIIMCVAVAASVIFGVISGISSKSAMDVSSSIYLMLLVLSPLSLYISFSYPFYRFSKAAFKINSAVVGNGSLEEYATTSVVTLSDTNLFPSVGVKVQNIRIYNNARIDRLLYYASSVFAKAGGPLADVFEVATIEMGNSDDVEILAADKGFLDTKTDGINITFGSYAALTAREFDIPEDIAMDDVDFSDEMSIMYMFREKVLVAKMYIKYVIDGDFETIISQFDDFGMYVCVKTYDPNIDEDMIASKLDIESCPVKVVRFANEAEVECYSERSDSGLVSLSSPKSLLQLLPYCDKTIHTRRTGGALTIMSIIISLILMVIFKISGSLSEVNSLYVCLYHMGWMIPTFFASRIFI